MARSIWSGAISFRLLNIPVSLMSAKEEERLSFNTVEVELNLFQLKNIYLSSRSITPPICIMILDCKSVEF